MLLPICLFALLSWAAEECASRSSTIPEDVYAFPKYKIQFLNGRPVLNVTAQRWLQDGLISEDEFLGSYKNPSSSSHSTLSVKEIAGSTQDELAAPEHSSSPPPILKQMRLGSAEYLCLLLPPPDIPAPPEDSQQAPQPIHTWELLQPLEGTCLYHRQGWFSYAYCHGQHVRQFREKEPQLPLGMNAPLEDPSEPSYLLGHAPTNNGHHDDETEGHGSATDQTALANRLELARGAGHRYLNMHWGGGTVCDKTGRKREIEVQFHCSMTTTDTIFYIKETKTCSYTLVIHTPRLCGEPGFRSPREDIQDTPLRCRKVVDTLEGSDPTLPESSLPFQRREPKPLPAPRHTPTTGTGNGNKIGGKGGIDSKDRGKMLKAALDAVLGRKDKGTAGAGAGGNGGGNDQEDNVGGSLLDGLETLVTVTVDENGELQIEKMNGDEAKMVHVGDDMADVMEIELAVGEDPARLMRILREAGYDTVLPGAEQGGSKKKGDDDEELPSRDEL